MQLYVVLYSECVPLAVAAIASLQQCCNVRTAGISLD